MGPSAYPQTRREFLHHAHVIKIEERYAGLHRSGHRHFVAVGQQVIAQGEAGVPPKQPHEGGRKHHPPPPPSDPFLDHSHRRPPPKSHPPHTSPHHPSKNSALTSQSLLSL